MIAAATAREQGRLEVFVNISQMTVSQMTLTDLTGSPQHLLHLLAELVLNWSGLPVVHVRPTVFLENPFFLDFARVANPAPHLGRDLQGGCWP